MKNFFSGFELVESVKVKTNTLEYVIVSAQVYVFFLRKKHVHILCLVHLLPQNLVRAYSMSLNINCLLDQKCCLPWKNHVVFLCRNFFQLRTLSRQQRGSEGTTLYVLLLLLLLFFCFYHPRYFSTVIEKKVFFIISLFPNFWICTRVVTLREHP